MAIGLRGGRLKATSGYAFRRIQRDSAAFVDSLQKQGHPFLVPDDPLRYRVSDSLLLDIKANDVDQIERISCALFKYNPGERILRFFNQDARPLEQRKDIPALPSRLFIETLIKKGGASDS